MKGAANVSVPDSTGFRDAAIIMYLSQKGYDFTKEQIGEPFGGYTDFADCVSKNHDKGDAPAYCGAIKHRVEDIAGTESYAGSQARKTISEKLKPRQQRLRFLAEKDSTTCDVCQGLDGSTYEIDEEPDLPVHPGCRCSYQEFEVEERIRVFGSVKKLSETLRAESFSWYPDINRLRELGRKQGGKFLLIEGIHPMTTDPFNVGHGARQWSDVEVMKAARTAVGKGMNINHEVELSPKYKHVIMDGDYNERTKTAEYIVYEEDPQVLDLIRRGYITRVSMQGYPRREVQVCDSCGTTGCSCHAVPEGVMFGEGDGVAMAYVVTQEGARYNGMPLKAERPGDWNTSIQLMETSSFRQKSKTRDVQLLRSYLASNVPNPQIQERILYAERYLIKEDLQSFNDALASGDAVRALSVIANDMYAQMNNAKQSMPDPAQQPQAQTGPFQNGQPMYNNVEDSSFGSATGANAVGTMPQQPPSDVPRKVPPVPQGMQPQQYSQPPGKSPPPNKKMPQAQNTEAVDYATDQGDPRSAPGVPRKQTIPDKGVDDDNTTLHDGSEGDDGSDKMPPRDSSKQGKIAGGNPSGAKSVEKMAKNTEAHEDDDSGGEGGDDSGSDASDSSDDSNESLRKEITGIKQSLKNLSVTLQEIQKAQNKMASSPQIRETIKPKSPTMADIPRLRERIMYMPVS